jgi:hypothetical protein
MTETEAVVNWVLQGNARKRKTINRKVSSYGLKHVVEKDIGQYIGNDSFIAAMDTLGFDKEQIKGTPNYFFNIHLEKNNG